jgi:hypothetical protein
MIGYDMAGANLPAKKFKHSTPTQLRLVFSFDEGESGGYIDLAQALSVINRRFMRQGCYYYINSFEVESLQDGYVQIEVAPDTWVTQQSWKRAFGTFQKMNSMVDTPRPKYHDFKVFLDANHRNDVNNGNGNKRPILTGGIGVSGGIGSDEWDYAQFVNFNDRDAASANPNQFNMHVVGDHVTTNAASLSEYASVGMIKSYARSRVLPAPGGEPEIPTNNDDDPLTLLFQQSEVHALEEIAEHLDTMNDTTPYDRDFYVGQSDIGLVPLERLYTSSMPNGRAHKVSGACVPFGLMRISSDGYGQGWRLIINVASGTYNGVYAERV